MEPVLAQPGGGRFVTLIAREVLSLTRHLQRPSDRESGRMGLRAIDRVLRLESRSSSGRCITGFAIPGDAGHGLGVTIGEVDLECLVNFAHVLCVSQIGSESGTSRSSIGGLA
jgi:hypothetical protein